MTNQKIRIILLGKSGSGKSQTGNNLGQLTPGFKVNPGGDQVTVDCDSAVGERFGKQLLIIDTPGIWGEENENKALLDEIQKSVEMAHGGPLVFLLVTEMGRNVEFHKIMLRYKHLFGEKMFKYSIVLFTNFDSWKDRLKYNGEDPDVHQYLLSLHNGAKEILQMCCGRYAVLDNRNIGGEMDGHLRLLMEKIKDLVIMNMTNNEDFFTEEKNTICTEQHDRMHLVDRKNSLWRNIPFVILSMLSFIGGILFHKYLHKIQLFARGLLRLFQKLPSKLFSKLMGFFQLNLNLSVGLM